MKVPRNHSGTPRRRIVRRRPLVGATIGLERLRLFSLEDRTLRREVRASPEVLVALGAPRLFTAAADEPADGEGKVAGCEDADDNQQRYDERVGLPIGIHDRCTAANYVAAGGRGTFGGRTCYGTDMSPRRRGIRESSRTTYWAR